MNELEKLDFVLDKYNIRNIAPDNLLIRKTIIDFNEEEDIIYKLKKDGYIQYADSKYSITYDGRVFINDGGYVKQNQKEKTLLDEINGRNKRAERKEDRLNFWTMWLAIGTFALVIIELIVHRKEIFNLCGYN